MAALDLATQQDLDQLRRELAELRAQVAVVAKWSGVPADELLAVARSEVKAKTETRRGWLKAKEAALFRAGARCEVCGYSGPLNVHHKVPRSEGGTDDLGNLAVLCPTHHAEAHAGPRTKRGPD